MTNRDWILIVVMIIFALLFWWCYTSKPETNIEMQQIRQAYKDSLEVYKADKIILRTEIGLIKESYKEKIDYNDSLNATLKNENRRLTDRLSKLRTTKVEELIKSDIDLNAFVLTQDTIIQQLTNTVDTLQLQRRIEQRIVEDLVEKYNDLDSTQQKEVEYVKYEVVKRDSIIDTQAKTINKLEKNSKKKNWLIGFLALLNLVPRQ